MSILAKALAILCGILVIVCVLLVLQNASQTLSTPQNCPRSALKAWRKRNVLKTPCYAKGTATAPNYKPT